MELSFLPDSMTRYAYNAWHAYPNREEAQSYTIRSGSKHHSELQEEKVDEKNCSICRRNRKRILSLYIKSKHRDCRSPAAIAEEKGGEEEEQEEK